MSPEKELQDVFTSLKSRLKRDQENGLEAVAILVKQERFISYLFDGTRENGINWDTLFLCVHFAIFTQADKKGEATTKKLKETMKEALGSVVPQSHGQIRTSSLISAILDVFSSVTARLCIGSSYLDLLTNMLQSDKHLAQIKSDKWSELIAVLLNLFEEGGPGSTTCRYLEILGIIVENGTRNALSTNSLKLLLPFLERNLLTEREPSHRYDMALLRLVNLTLIAMAADCRYSVVDFVEATTSKVVRMYEPGKDKNQHIFEFLDLAVNVHHPEGASIDDSIAYAGNWNLWKGHISEIFYMCEKEVVEVVRSGERCQLLPHFLNVLVDVAHLHWQFRPTLDESPVFEDRPASPMPGTFGKRKSVDYMWTQTQKRARTASLEGGIAHVLESMPSTDAWFWLEFTHSLLVKYPSFIKKDVARVTEKICHMFCEVRNPITIELLSRCASHLLVLEKATDDLSQMTRATFAASWDKVAETSLRNIVKNNVEEYHTTIQALISHSKMNDINILLESYLNKTIVPSDSSIQTMTCLLLKTTIEEHKKVDILEWGLENISSPLPAVNLALAALLREVKTPENKLETKMIRSYCDIYKDVAFKFCESSEVLSNKVEKAAAVSGRLAGVILEKLKSHSDRFAELLGGDNVTYEDFSQAGVIVEVLLRILSAVWDRCDWLKNELCVIIQKLFNAFAKAVDALLNARCIRLEILSHIYTLDVRLEVLSLIRDPEFANQLDFCAILFENFEEMRLEPTFSLHKKRWAVPEELQCHYEYTSDFRRLVNSLQPSDKSVLARECLGRATGLRVFLLAVTDALCSFIKSTATLTFHQEILMGKVVRSLFEDRNLSADNPLHMQMALTVICAVATIKCCPVSVLNITLELLTKICGSLYLDRDMNVVGMTILKGMVPIVKSRGDETSRRLFSDMLEGFYVIVNKKTKYSVQRLVEPFVKLVGEVFSADFNVDDCLWNKQEEMTGALIELLSHESTSIRLTVAKLIGSLFTQCGDVQEWQRRALSALASNLSRNDYEEDPYRKVTMCASSLMALGYVLASVTNLRINVAYLCIKFIRAQDCDIDMVRNFLRLLSKELRVAEASKYFALHLNHFLEKWLMDGRHLEVFPYQILNLKSRGEFYLKYTDVIVSQAYVNENQNVVEEISAKLQHSTSTLVKTALPAIMAIFLFRKEDAKLQHLLRSATFYIECVPPLLHFLLRQTNTRSDFLRAFETFKVYFSDSDSPLLLELATSHSFSVQKCLLLLETDLVEAVTPEDHSESFRKYMWFVEHYIEGKGNTLVAQVDCYVLRDSVSNGLRVIRKANELWLIQQSCSFLKTIISSFLRGYSPDISALLPGIVSALLPKVSSSESVKDLLRFLVINNRRELWSAIQRLDPFPDDSDFSELNAELRACRENSGLLKELELFSSFVGPTCRRIGGLSRLLSSLSENKTDLCALFKRAHARRGFSEDCRESVLHQVISQLMTLCSHSDEVIRSGAAKCLGELGPADLATLVLKYTADLDENHVTCDLRLLDSVVPLLGQLVQQEELSVKKAASDALYAAFRCNAMPSHSSAYLAPFQTQIMEEYQLKTASDTGPPLSVWMPASGVSHEVWVIDLVTGLLEILSASHGLCSYLSAVCQVHAVFSEQALPNIVDCIVTLGSRALVADVGRNITAVLRKHIQDPSSLNLKSIRCIVSVLDYVRNCAFRERHFLPCLDVDYLLIAQAAKDCELYFISLIFAELWFEQQKKSELMKDKNKLRLSIDELEEHGTTLSRVLRENYANIGISDGLEGCGSSHLADPALRVAHLEHLGRWDISLLTHDVTRNVAGVARSLSYFGLFETLSHLTADVSTKLDCAARLGDWSIISPDASSSYPLHRYGALRAYHHQDYPSFLSEIEKATESVLTEIRENKIESMRKIYQQMSQLQCLKELQDFATAVGDESVLKLKEKWDLQDLLPHSEFSLKESVLTSRCLIINEELKRKDTIELKDLLCEQYLKLCKLARSEKKYEVAMRNALLLNQVSGASLEMQLNGRVEEARSLWGKGEQKLGLRLLAGALKGLEGSNNRILHSKCLRIYGDWMVETKAENPLKIISDYFMKSLSLTSDINDKLDSYASIAKFADSHYVQLREYLDSSHFTIRNEIRIQQNSLMFGLKKDLLAGKKDHDKQVAFNLASKQSAIDEDEIASLNGECGNFLSLAIKYYLLSLQGGDKYDDFVFRLVSLWLNNGSREEVVKILRENLDSVPSHKFICLLPQMAPRMGDVSLIKGTVERMLKDHPHHTLPELFALSNSYADFPYLKSPRVIPPPTKRVLAAKELLRNASKNPRLSNQVFQMAKLTDAFLEFANRDFDIPRTTQGPLKLPSTFLLPKIENLDTTLVPSLRISPNPNLRYNNIIGVQKFENQFEMVGGINAPKKLICIGTDGIRRPLLLKGKDDPRQDAVMQQVFEIMNRLLARDVDTARRKLVMRTYRVQPLSQRSGVIEWLEDTQTLGLYLIGKSARGGAHGTHHPEDLTAAQCRQIYAAVSKADTTTKLQTYLEICSKLKPALHYFFIENFPTACVWFERRLAYIRSVATSSMIGYILGIGDRHLMNILIDNKTAEAIHIDLGIAFEQGRVLPTPETVPFRLTRDIEDGMGCSGVEGVYRTCCEKTMKVMRENKDTILTLLEVLLYDPLYCWSVSPEKAMSMQNRNTDSSTSQELDFEDSNTENGVNPMAERALSRLKDKLQGMEQGGVVSTVEGQVGGLIQKARDPANLCRLFQGWQPYL